MARGAAMTARVLRFDGELALSRDQDGAARSFLELAASPGPLSRRSARLMDHEYALRAELDPAFALQPAVLVTERGRVSLRFEDPDPESELLSERVGRPWPIAAFLRSAIAITSALRAMHSRG